MTTPNRPRVYIVNVSRDFDFSKAERFGELVVCTRGTININNLQQPIDNLTEALRDFGPQDYLLLAGNAISNALALMVTSKNTPTINLVIYNAGENNYRHHRFNTKTMKIL